MSVAGEKRRKRSARDDRFEHLDSCPGCCALPDAAGLFAPNVVSSFLLRSLAAYRCLSLRLLSGLFCSGY